MKGKLRLFFICLLVIVLGWSVNLIWYKPFFIKLYFERLFIEYGMRHPEMLTKTRLLEHYGYYKHNCSLNDISLEYRKETYKATTRAFEMLRSYKRNKLSRQEKLSHHVLDFYLEKRIFRQQFFQHEIPLNHLNGMQTALPLFLKEYQIVESLQDAENYLSRISHISDKVYQYIQTIMLKEEGEKPPVFVFEYMMDQIDCFLTADVQNNLIYQDFKTKIEAAKLINPEAKGELLYDLKLEIGDNVYPAFRELKIKLEVEKEHASKISGIWRYNDGDTYYYLLLNENLTIDTSIYDLEQRALTEIDRLHKKIAKKLHVPIDKNFKEHLQTFTTSHILPRNNEADLVRMFTQQVNTILQQNGASILVRDIDIKEAASFNANYKLIEYFPASLDGYKKASLHLSNYLLGFVPQHMLTGLVLSEVFPGNHFINQAIHQSQNLPNIRKVINFNTYKNGWKYYILEQAEKLGFSKTEAEAIGHLQWQLLYASTAVADLRIHQRMFTRAEAIDFVMQETGLPRPLVLTFIDEIIVQPAEAPSFLVGFDAFKNYDKYLLKNEDETFSNTFSVNSRRLASFGPLPIKLLPEVLPLLSKGKRQEKQDALLVGKPSE